MWDRPLVTDYGDEHWPTARNPGRWPIAEDRARSADELRSDDGWQHQHARRPLPLVAESSGIVWAAAYKSSPATCIVAELDSETLQTVRTGSGPEYRPSGMGGTSKRVWYCGFIDNWPNYTSYMYELSPVDFSVVRSLIAAGSTYNRVNIANGAGGDDTVFWTVTPEPVPSPYGHDYLAELDVDTLARVRYGGAWGSVGHGSGADLGVGGTADTIWACYYKYIREADPDDFSIIREIDTSPVVGNSGIGGSDDRVWRCIMSGYNANLVEELDPEDMSVLLYATIGGETPTPMGIGGGK